MDLLQSLIYWIKPPTIEIRFKHNELDDQDIEQFVINGMINAGINMTKLLVVSNPGIYKGQFLTNLKEAIKTYNENPKHS